MFQWVLSKKWLPEVILGAFASAILGSIDYVLQGSAGLIASLIFCSAFFFFRQFAFLGGIFVAGATTAELLLHVEPVVAGFAAILPVFLAGIFASRRSGLVFLAASSLSGLAMVYNVSFNTQFLTDIYGIHIYNESGRWWGFLFSSITVIGLNGFVWLLGAFIVENINQRRVSVERDAFESVNLRALLDLSEQNERFAIARDLNEVIMQRVSALLTLADGARFAAKLQPEVSGRTLERLVVLLRGVHEEMRRMFDMLNKTVAVSATPPNIADLQGLAAQYRELGYQAKIQHLGKPIPLIASAELNIYRIVFDALSNIKEHAPVGTAIDIDFIWSEHGLQILVKDNGAELGLLGVENELLGDAGYTANDDLLALTQEVTGAGITGMRERAQLFQGSVEAKRVPGVGFTLNAIFPGINEFEASQEDS